MICSPPAHVAQAYLSQNPANQAQHKWLVLTQCTWGSETQLHCVTTVKINARVMITTNIDVSDWLTNATMGTVTNVVTDQTTGMMSVILVAFDSEHVG